VFVLILPRGDHCPMCDAVTVRVHAPALHRLRLPLVKRWCLVCGWDGVMRRASSAESSGPQPGGQTATPAIVEQPSRRS
jgi:hypothetical protein